MFVMFYGIDKPGSQSKRANLKSRHSARLNRGADGIRVLQSGPLLDDKGQEVGSLGILEAESCDAVSNFMAKDPYIEEGIFEEVVIREWLWRRGNPYV